MTDRDREETYLTVAEVAATLKINQQTVRNWIDAGRIPALRMGRRVRIKSSDFDRILEESYSGTPAAETRAGELTAGGFWGGEPVGPPSASHGGATAAEDEMGDVTVARREAETDGPAR